MGSSGGRSRFWRLSSGSRTVSSRSYWVLMFTEHGLTLEPVALTTVRHFSLSAFQTPPRLGAVRPSASSDRLHTPLATELAIPTLLFYYRVR